MVLIRACRLREIARKWLTRRAGSSNHDDADTYCGRIADSLAIGRIEARRATVVGAADGWVLDRSAGVHSSEVEEIVAAAEARAKAIVVADSIFGSDSCNGNCSCRLRRSALNYSD